jgi:hypothetical protein
VSSRPSRATNQQGYAVHPTNSEVRTAYCRSVASPTQGRVAFAYWVAFSYHAEIILQSTQTLKRSSILRNPGECSWRFDEFVISPGCSAKRGQQEVPDVYFKIHTEQWSLDPFGPWHRSEQILACAPQAARNRTDETTSCSRFPRIEHGHSHTFEVGYISSRHGQPVHEGRGCDESVSIGTRVRYVKRRASLGNGGVNC